MKHPLADCENCPYKNARYVPSEVPQGASIAFVGEAPGQTEARVGKPFVGVSGKLLQAVMNNYGINRSECVMTNVVSCKPPRNEDPPKEAINACHPRLVEELSGVETVVALGNTAATAILGYRTKITKDRVGLPKNVNGKRVIPTIHPAAILRSPDNFPFLSTDISKIHHANRASFVPPKFKCFYDARTAEMALRQLLDNKGYDPITLDLEVGHDKDEDFSHPDNLLAAGIGYKPGFAVVIGEDALRSTKIRSLLSELIKDKHVICHNGKYDLQVLLRLGVVSHGRMYWDTMLASYCLDERPGNGTHGLKYLAKELLGAPNWDAEIKQYKSFSDIPKDTLYKYNAYDAALTYDLYELQKPQIEAEGQEGLLQMLLDYSEALMYIEAAGIKVDRKALERLRDEFDADITQLVKRLREHVTPVVESKYKPGADDKELERMLEFNPNSPQQVKRALKECFGAKVSSTDEDTLKLIIETADKIVASKTESSAEWTNASRIKDFCELMLEHRKTAKLKGTYVDGIIKRLRDDGRATTSFLIHGTTTGRLSSRNPNLQNIPRGKSIRPVFIPDAGNIFIQADYGNIEGRNVCVLSQCRTLAQWFREGRDVHGEVAERFFGPGWTKEQRVIAKSIVHGTNYGRTAHGIAGDPDIQTDEKIAQVFIDFYFDLFPEILDWQKATIHEAINGQNYLTTPYGRKRRFMLITRENREDIEKEAIAFKPQSIASDICMIAVCNLVREGINVRLPVHDSILVECREDEQEHVADRMVKVMEDAALTFTDYIPYSIDVERGYSWGDLS